MDASDLGASPLFAGLAAQDLTRLSQVMRVENHPRGTVLVEEGDIPSTFFVLLDGNVTVHREGRHVGDLGPGDYFGEVGVLALERRNASVIATTPVRVAVAMGWDLRALLEQADGLRTELTRAAASRTAPA